MKIWRIVTVGRQYVLMAAFLFGTSISSEATLTNLTIRTNSPYAWLASPVITNIPGAVYTVSNILATPAAAMSMPTISITNSNPLGTYYSLQNNSWPPLPGNFYPTLPIYELDVTNNIFIIDDRSVDYDAMQQLADAEAATNGSESFRLQANNLIIDTNSLWLEVPTNALPGSNLFNIVIHQTTTGDFYDVLTKTDLLLPSWTVENTVTGAVGNSTLVTISQNGRTNLFVRARTAFLPIYTQPMTQEVLAGDTVTFTVAAGGDNLFYQWTLNGTNIYGATGSSYTINNVQSTDAGDYAVIITSAAGTVSSQTAVLTVDAGTGNADSMTTLGQRQDYTFRSGVNYYIASTVQLYGSTTIEGGAVIKFDYTQAYPSLQVMGMLNCKGTPYNPSILTTIDDDSFGKAWSYGAPHPVVTGVPYLDLTEAGNQSISNLRFRFADEAIATPVGGQLDIWDSQFFQCDASVINEFGGTDRFHNVLFAGCYDAVAASANSFAITAEHVTADVTNFWDSSISPTSVGLTNSIILGNVIAASIQNTMVNPDLANFQTNGAGNYYLTCGSSLHQAGTTNVSAQLLNEFRNKTTYAPLAFPSQMQLSGNLTLFPQTPRYTNGVPDIGYYYDALDYTVAGMTNFGTITVEPGTAIGFREDLNINSYWGFVLRENSSFVSHGTPTRPNVFADAQGVQEQFEYACYADFVPDFESGDTNQPGPIMDFRFCDFYAAVGWYHVWAGNRSTGDFMASYNSVVNWTMRDCNLHCGQISLGEPDNGRFFGIPYTTIYGSGAVIWNNNLFDNVLINLQPTYDWYDGTVNVDLAFQARNNLFRNCGQFFILPVPASAGNWTLTDNLFDQVEFSQDPSLALDFDYNGYWPPTSVIHSGDTTQLQPTTTGDGSTNGLNEVVLSYAPPYTSGTFGDYYFSTLTPLYGKGSQTAGAAGLAQYTSSTNQTKEGATHTVNIGLHYIAALNEVPLDSDGDGVPDYMEDANGNGVVDANETDPNIAMTDGTTSDAYSTVYDDVDLSGNGLVGRIKKALNINPLSSSNPLTPKQVITGNEPDIVTFEVPISYDILTNIGEINLNVDGAYTSWQGCYRGTNGNCWLEWNTLYNLPGQRLLQANFNLKGMTPWGDIPDLTILKGNGSITAFDSKNILEFDPVNCDFSDSGATLYAKLSVTNVSYSIEVQSADGIHIKTILGSTSTDEINDSWNLTDDNLNTVTNEDVSFIYTITPVNTYTQFTPATPNDNPTTKKPKQKASKSGGIQDGDFTIACAYNNRHIALTAMWDCVEYGMVDPLISIAESGGTGSLNPYNSTFDNYTWYGDMDGYPGLLTSSNDAATLINNLTNLATRNFFMLGHGTTTDIGDGANPSQVDISKNQVADALGNGYSLTSNTIQRKHPYRFVFLYGCNTATLPEWSDAFGIRKTITINQANKGLAQAFIGWQGSPRSPGTDEQAWNDFSYALEAFSIAWMNNNNIEQCKALAQSPSLNWPFNKQFPAGTTNNSNFKLVTFGYPVLKRTGFD
jgi:hypothetical protein